MLVNYKGFEIDVRREESMGGDEMLYWSVFRNEDGMEMTSGLEYGDFYTVRGMVKHYKTRVDKWLGLSSKEKEEIGNF